MKNNIGPFGQAATNISLLAHGIVYSILTSIRITEVQDETPDCTTIDNLMLGNPDLYRIVLHTSKENNIENYRIN